MSDKIDLRKTPYLDHTIINSDENVATLVNTVAELIARYIALWNARQLRKHRYAYSSTLNIKALREKLEEYEENLSSSGENLEEGGVGHLDLTYSRREDLADLILRREMDPAIEEVKAELRKYGIDVKKVLGDARYWL